MPKKHLEASNAELKLINRGLKILNEEHKLVFEPQKSLIIERLLERIEKKIQARG